MQHLNTLPLSTKILLAMGICTMSILILGVMFYSTTQQNGAQALESFSTAMDRVQAMESPVDPSTAQELTAVFEDQARAARQRSLFMIVSLVIVTTTLNLVVGVFIARNIQADMALGTDLRIEDMSDSDLAQVLERVARRMRSRTGVFEQL